MKKKIILLFIFLISLIGILSTKFIIKTLAETKYCGSITECFVGVGSGTESDPYQISTPEQLNAIRYDLSASYKLMNDIDLTYDTQNKNGLFYNDGLGWEAIGSWQYDTYGNPFMGIFDGNHYSITGLYSNSTTLSFNGLFGYAKDATIKNIKLKNVDMNNEGNVGYMCQETETSSGGSISGSVSGALVGTTTNTLIENVGVTGKSGTGGIVGCAGYNSVIKNSYNAARVIGTGGISGSTNGTTLENVYNSGEIGIDGFTNTGGITGSLNYSSKILNAYNTGVVHGSGIVYSTSSGTPKLMNTIFNVYNLGLVTGSNIIENVGDVVLSNAYGVNIMSNNNKIGKNSIIENYNSYSVELLKDINVYSGFDFNTVWEIDSTTGYHYPKLRGIEHIELEEENSFSGGIGKIYDPYQIATLKQLNEIRNFYGKSFILNNDIDLTYETQNEKGLFYNDRKGWGAIGTSDSPFFGTFDGNDYKIIGLFSNRTENAGLFGYIKNSAITDVIMKDVNITSTENYAAGLVAYTSSSYINNVLVSGNVNGGGNCYNCSSGGIVAFAYDSNLTNLVNLSNIESTNRAGGIVGSLGGGSLINSYNAGMVSSSSYTGGLIGYVDTYEIPTTIRECYNVGQVISSHSGSGLAVGYLAKSISNVFSLDFGKEMIGETGISVTTSNVSIKTIDELKDVDTYSDWANFNNNYKIETINNVTRFPVLKTNNTSYIDNIAIIDKISLKINGKLQSTTLDYEISASGVYSDNVIIKSNDESVVTVDSNGIISAVSPGNTTLTVYGYDGYKINIPIEVLELTYTSDKYDLTKDYIYVRQEDFDINEVNVNNGTKVYEDYKLKILDGDYIVKEYEIVQVLSEKFDLSNDYIILNQDYKQGDISAINGSVRLDYSSSLNTNIFNIFYNSEVIDYFYLSNFKDQKLYNCIIDTYNKKNNTDLPYTTHLDDEQLLTISHLNCNNSDAETSKKIKLISGINKLENLEYLELSNNDIEFLDLTYNVKLKTIWATHNKLTGVYVKTISGLETLVLDHNNITNLDITSNKNLKYLSITDNLLKTLNVKNNINLKDLIISNVYNGGNENNITSIDLSQNTLLEQLGANRNGLGVSGLDLSKNVNLKRLYLNGNNFSSLDLTNNKNLLILEISHNKLKNINIDGLSSLTSLSLGRNKLTSLNLNTNTALVNLGISDNKIKTLDLTNNLNLFRIDLSENDLASLDISNNSNNINNLYIYGNKFNEDIVIYKGISTAIPNSLNNIKLPSNYQISLSNITSDNKNIIIDKNKIAINEIGDYILVGNYSHNIQMTSNNFTVNYNVHVIEAESDKYEINAEAGYIYTKTDVDANTILSNINLNYGKGKIENNKYNIYYEDELVKSFDIVNISSNKYDLSKDYIFEYEENSITINNGTISKNIENNTIEIKYGEKFLDIYKSVEVNSGKYNLFSSNVKVQDNNINNFLGSINCINCVAKIYDGDNYITEDFTENNKLRIMYGEDVLKEYNLTFFVSGITLNKENVKLGLENKKTVQLEATISPKNAENKNISWTSSNEGIATVDENGLVTSKGLGKTTITATTEEGEYTDTVEIEVVNIITYKITYKDGESTYIEEYEEDEIVELKNDLAKDGYTLIVWKYNDKEYKLTDKFTMPGKDITMEAIWQANTYKVTYDYLDKIFDVIYDDSYGKLEEPIKKGYTFKGWYLDNTYKNKIDAETIVKTPSNHTLYAKFEINSYKLTIDPNEGEYNGEKELILNYNSKREIYIPTRVGYTFKNWKLEGIESKLENNIFTMGISDSKLIANWELIIPNIEATSKYKVKNTLITSISLGTTVDNLDLGLDGIYEIKIFNKNQEIKTEGNIATGDKLKIYLGDTLVSEYTLSVKGDVTGTGTSSISDVAKLYQYLKKKIDMDECYKEAGNVVSIDNEIKINDVAKLYQFIKKKINGLE